MHLVDHARRYIEETYERPFAERMLRRLLGLLLPYPARFRLALLGASLARPFAGLIGGRSMTAQRLRAMLRLAPRRLPPMAKAVAPAGPPRARASGAAAWRCSPAARSRCWRPPSTRPRSACSPAWGSRWW